MNIILNRRRLLIVGFAILFIFLLIQPTSAWYQGYKYRVTHNITGSPTWTSNLTNYQVLFNIYPSVGVSSGTNMYLGNDEIQDDYDDIRFTDVNDNLLNYTHFSTESGYAKFYVKVPTIVNSSSYNTTIYCYFVNSSASSASNFTNTFKFADPFEDSVVDPQWTTSGVSVATEGSGRLTTVAIENTYDDLTKAVTATTSITGNFSAIVSMAWEGQSSDLGQGYLYLGGSSDYMYIGWEDPLSTGNQYYKAAFKTKTYTGSAHATHSGSSTFEIRRNASTIYMYQGSNLLMTNTSSQEMTSLRLVHTRYTGGYNGKTQRWYYVAVLNYTTPEPTRSDYSTEMSVPDASWRSDYNKGGIFNSVGPTFKFIDLSAGTPTAWNWSFGDGDYSSEQHPVHTYANPGNYSVNLTATNEFGSDYSYKHNYIYVENYIFNRTVSVRINGSSSYDVYDYSMKWDIHNSSGTMSGNDYYSYGTVNISPDYDDIRFVTKNNTYAPHWIDWSDCDSDQVLMWCRYYHIPVEGETFYIKSGNSSAPNIQDPHNTFLHFDDFEWNNLTAWDLALSDWLVGSTTVKTGNYAGYAHVNVWESPNSIIYNNNTYRNVSIGGWFRSNVYHLCGSGFFIFDNNNGYMTYFLSAQNGRAKYSDGTNQDPYDWPYYTSLSVNTWYKMYGEIDLGTSKARLWINNGYNGEHTLKDMHADTMTTSNYFRDYRISGSAGWEGSGYDDFFVDDVWVRNYTYYEPNQTAWAEGDIDVDWYSSSPIEGANPLTITFYDNTTGGNPTAYKWDLNGDNIIDNTTRNASYTYTVLGYYNISHWASDTVSEGWHNVTAYVHCLGNVPTAAFSANVTSGYKPLVVGFTDLSTKSPTAWNWSFGDGDYSNSQNPSHTYVNGGTYTVSLNVSNADGFDWENKTDYITVLIPPPISAFTSNVTSGDRPLGVQFTDLSTGSPTAWNWSFGDGDYSNSQNPSHLYVSSGTYTVSLNASNIGGGDFENKTDYITVNAVLPIASFTSNVTGGYPPFTVQFTSTSTNTTAWDWYFPNGGDSHSEVATWTFDYNIGNATIDYDIKLKASNVDGFDWENKTGYMTAYPLEADFVAPTVSGIIPFAVSFTDLTSNGTPTAWNWSFGDGNYSNSQNPSHTYTTPGAYTVILNSSNLYSYDYETKSSYITVFEEPPSGAYIETVTYSGLTPYGVVLHGYTNTTDDVYFRWGTTPSETMPMKTDVQNTTGNFTQSVIFPFQSGKTYYYAAYNASGSRGDILSFTSAVITPVPTTTFGDTFFPVFANASSNLTELFDSGIGVYTGIFGSLFYVIIWLAIIGAIWLRTESVRLPLFIYIIVSSVMSFQNMFPAPVSYFVYITMVAAFAGVIWDIWSREK